jgi:uncharacterized protein YijF (DUF1287 family)
MRVPWATALILSGFASRAVGASGEGLGCRDLGIFPDLDGQVQLTLPKPLDPAIVEVVHVVESGVIVLYAEGRPLKVYPVRLRPGDRAELAPFVRVRPIRALGPGEAPRPGDRDRDGIPDPLDSLIGAKTLLLNRAAYVEGYKPLSFPGGDVPRQMGVCTDVIVRALRNAGLDLQAELHADIARAPRAYPMVRKRNPSIDHRRVKTLLPFFRRHMMRHGTDARDPRDPYQAGDIVFMDTFPSRSGPDHVGIVSDRLGASGLPLIINNWAPGSADAEMDLLPFVLVTDRFRLLPGARSSRPGRTRDH